MNNCLKQWMLHTLLVLTSSAALADQMVVGGTIKEGTFQKFENGRFEFMTAKGRFVRQGATQVSRLVLDKPMRVRFLRSDGKKEETGELQGFEKNAFQLRQGAQATTIPLAQIKAMECALDFGEGGGGDNRYPIPAIDIGKLAQGELTPQQQSAVNRFNKAKKAFDDFVVESTALEKQMEPAKGARRNELLNRLRERKITEQPLRKELGGAYRALVELFPEPAL
jgi:hypothetical protein